MLVFGHAGIALGAAVLLAGTISSRRFTKSAKSGAIVTSSPSSQAASASSNKESWVASLGERIDVRLLLLGSLLPDIIDKTLGHFLFKETLSSGRIFSHTLLFLIVITLAGLYLYRYRSRTWLLVLSFGVLVHLACDQMWLLPRALLWPVYGFTFERVDLSHWVYDMLYALLKYPEVYVPELVGLAIIVWFAWGLLRRRKVFDFIKQGQVQ